MFLLLQGLFSLVVVSRGYSLLVGCGLLILVLSLTLAHGLQLLQHVGSVVALLGSRAQAQ